MLISQLKEILYKYESEWSIQKIYREPEEISQIRAFLSNYPKISQSYSLNEIELYTLIKTIKYLDQATRLKDKVFANYFFEIIAHIESHLLLNENMFARIYRLEDQSRLFLFNLFFPKETKKIVLSMEALHQYLALAENTNLPHESIRKCILLLNHSSLLTEHNLIFIADIANEADKIYNILELLNTTDSLNDQSLSLLRSCEISKLATLGKLIDVFRFVNLSLDSNTLFKLLKLKETEHLFTASLLLTQGKEQCLDIPTFQSFLHPELDHWQEKLVLLRLFQEQNLLTIRNRDFIFTANQHTLRATAILAKLGLMNIKFIDNFSGENFNAYQFYRVINYLCQAKCLDQNVLNACISQLSKKPEFGLFKANIFDLLELLSTAHFYQTGNSLKQIFYLSEHNLERLYRILSLMIDTKLLDYNAFNSALERVQCLLPCVVESSATKLSKKISKADASMLIMDHNKIFDMVTTGHESATNKITKLYNRLETPLTPSPDFLIKKISQAHSELTQRLAKREVKYQHFLGRKAFFFTHNNKANIVTEWQEGKPLNLLTKSELLKSNILTRLKCLTSLLSEVNKLHTNYRAHNDIKNENLVLDLKNAALKLINFKKASKNRSSRWLNRESHDPAHMFFNQFHYDVTAMGIIVRQLFPELYDVRHDIKSIVLFKSHKHKLIEHALIKLSDAMLQQDYTEKCTCEDALIYCNEIINNYKFLDEKFLYELEKQTISRTDTQLEDTLRETKRI